jgi:hypothetical protein
MAISADQLRRHYASLSDMALLELNPDELTPVARACYDEEFSKRGLTDESGDEADPDVPPPSAGDEPPREDERVCVAEYDYVEEADLAKGLLEAAEIAAVIDRDGMHVRLMVPPDLADHALQLLTAPLSDEELAAQAEAAGAPDSEAAGAESDEEDEPAER